VSSIPLGASRAAQEGRNLGPSGRRHPPCITIHNRRNLFSFLLDEKRHPTTRRPNPFVPGGLPPMAQAEIRKQASSKVSPNLDAKMKRLSTSSDRPARRLRPLKPRHETRQCGGNRVAAMGSQRAPVCQFRVCRKSRRANPPITPAKPITAVQPWRAAMVRSFRGRTPGRRNAGRSALWSLTTALKFTEVPRSGWPRVRVHTTAKQSSVDGRSSTLYYTIQCDTASVFMMAPLDYRPKPIRFWFTRAEHPSHYGDPRGERTGWYTCRASPSKQLAAA